MEVEESRFERLAYPFSEQVEVDLLARIRPRAEGDATLVLVVRPVGEIWIALRDILHGWYASDGARAVEHALRYRQFVLIVRHVATERNQ